MDGHAYIDQELEKKSEKKSSVFIRHNVNWLSECYKTLNHPFTQSHLLFIHVHWRDYLFNAQHFLSCVSIFILLFLSDSIA